MPSSSITITTRLGIGCLLAQASSPQGRPHGKEVHPHTDGGKRPIRYAVSFTFLLWSHLGLNQGLPDYESGALTN